jgi:hypothetical protein
MEELKMFIAFRFTMPCDASVSQAAGAAGLQARRRVRSDSVEVDAPAFGKHPLFLPRVEDLSP